MRGAHGSVFSGGAAREVSPALLVPNRKGGDDETMFGRDDDGGVEKKGSTTLRVPKSSLTSVLTKPVAA